MLDMHILFYTLAFIRITNVTICSTININIYLSYIAFVTLMKARVSS